MLASAWNFYCLLPAARSRDLSTEESGPPDHGNLPRVSAKGSAALDLFSSDSKEETQSPGVHVGSGLAQVCLLCELQNNGEHACPESRLTREKPGLSHHTLQPDNYFFFGVRMDRRRLVVEYQGLQLNVIIIS
jgi:hypothetical protein